MPNRNPKGLSKDDSLIIKGVAILAMMWNHCFLEGRFEGYDLSFFPLGQGRVASIASFMKICVSLFAFVSGYGLYCSLNNSEAGRDAHKTHVWYVVRYIKSFSDYWLVVVLAWIACQLLDGHTHEVYFAASRFRGVFYMLVDFLGLASLFDTPKMIATWWYMSAAFVFILLAPLLYRLLKQFGGVFCLGMIAVGTRLLGGFPGGVHYLSFLPAFALGMACAQEDFFERVRSWAEASSARYIAAVALLCALTGIGYRFNKAVPTKLFWDVKWGLFVVVYVSLIVLTFARVPVLRAGLRFLGDWSADIFLIHSFFRAHYATDFVYGSGSFVLVMVRLLALGLLASAVFRIVKKALRYDAIISALIERVLK